MECAGGIFSSSSTLSQKRRGGEGVIPLITAFCLYSAPCWGGKEGEGGESHLLRKTHDLKGHIKLVFLSLSFFFCYSYLDVSLQESFRLTLLCISRYSNKKKRQFCLFERMLLREEEKLIGPNPFFPRLPLPRLFERAKFKLDLRRRPRRRKEVEEEGMSCKVYFIPPPKPKGNVE